MDEVERLKVENEVLKDLLESAYRKIDEARLESDKADDEALQHKTENMKLKLGISSDGYAVMWEWKRRAEKAEEQLAMMRRVVKRKHVSPQQG